MGIFDALTTAVSGLQAQSFALQNISGNIANSQTIGYKETDTAFDALVSQAALGEQTSGGVFATSVASNGVQGTIQNETVATDMAVNGNGYFVVTKPTGNSGTIPQFSGVNDYTRRGDFQMDSNGYMVNGAGYYLMGIPVDPATGAPTAQLAPGLAIQQQFPPGAVDDEYQLRGKPAQRSADRFAHSWQLQRGPHRRWDRNGAGSGHDDIHESIARRWFHHRLRFLGQSGQRSVPLGRDSKLRRK